MNPANPAPRRHRSIPRLALGWIAVLAMAIAFSQTLGAMHRVVHAHHGSAPGRAVSAALHQVGGEAIEASWLKGLFAGHDSKSSCDQYDALSHADMAAGKVCQVVAQMPSEAVTAFHAGWRLAAQAAGFLARGPPARV